MIKLVDVNEQIWLSVISLSVGEEQKKFLDKPIGIVARGYIDESAPDCYNMMYHFCHRESLIKRLN